MADKPEARTIEVYVAFGDLEDVHIFPDCPSGKFDPKNRVPMRLRYVKHLCSTCKRRQNVDSGQEMLCNACHRIGEYFCITCSRPVCNDHSILLGDLRQDPEDRLRRCIDCPDDMDDQAAETE